MKAAWTVNLVYLIISDVHSTSFEMLGFLFLYFVVSPTVISCNYSEIAVNLFRSCG